MSRDLRDQRDPQKLGELISTYRQLSDGSAPWGILVVAPVPDYDDGGHISNDPALHHSKTPQTDNERISGQTELVYDVTKDPDETRED